MPVLMFLCSTDALRCVSISYPTREARATKPRTVLGRIHLFRGPVALLSCTAALDGTAVDENLAMRHVAVPACLAWYERRSGCHRTPTAHGEHRAIAERWREEVLLCHSAEYRRLSYQRRVSSQETRALDQAPTNTTTTPARQCGSAGYARLLRVLRLCSQALHFRSSRLRQCQRMCFRGFTR